jgi:hypothetical protein
MTVHKFLVIFICLFASKLTFGGQEITVALPSEKTDMVIPYKQEAQSISEQAVSAIGITVMLLGVVACGLQIVRRRTKAGSAPLFFKPAKIEVKERIRLNKSTFVFVVAYHGREFMLIQSSDHVTQIAEFLSPSVKEPTDAV